MAHAAVRADLDQALDVERHLAAQVAFHLVSSVDQLAQPVDLLLGQIAHPCVGVDVALGKDLLSRRKSDAVYVGKRHLDAFFARDVDAGDARH